MSVIKSALRKAFLWFLRKVLQFFKRFSSGEELILQHVFAEVSENKILQEINSVISSANIVKYSIENVSGNELLRLSDVIVKELPVKLMYERMLKNIEAKVTEQGKYESNIIELCEVLAKNSPSVDISYSRIKTLLFEYTDIFASQEGEDILLKRMMKDGYNKEGFYIDVGAFHPYRFSNTLHFYLRGWSGLNIDPTPTMKEEFDKVRPRDINVQAGISLSNELLEYHMFKEPAFNTFSENNKEYAVTRTEYERSIKIQTYRLDEILDKYLPVETPIMFCSIDVEGFECDVIESNNWDKYRPNILLVENIDEVSNIHVVEEKIIGHGYMRVAQTKNTVFYMELSYYETVK